MATPRQTPFLKDVAARAGVHLSTASLALRGDERIPAVTREKVRAAADALGYRPNALISALNAARRRGGVIHHQAGLAYVGYHQDRDRLTRDPFQRDLFAGARDQAVSLGYTLDYLWLREPDMNVARFQQILDHRRIHGLVLAPLDDPREDYELDWSRFVAVAIGLSLERPRLPRVLHDNYRAMLAVLAELEALGVQRVGLCLAAESDERTLGMWTGAYLATGRRRPGWCAPPLIVPGFNARDFSAWRRAERVEAVISVHPVLPLLQAALRKTRVKLVSLNLNGADETTPGIYQEPRILGAAAVERVVDLLHRGGRSAAVERADELLHLGRWRPGA